MPKGGACGTVLITFHLILVLSERWYQILKLFTGGPSFSRTFYLQMRIRLLAKEVQNDRIPVKQCLFIFELKIRGPE